jgi:hypothetical protein
MVRTAKFRSSERKLRIETADFLFQGKERKGQL